MEKHKEECHTPPNKIGWRHIQILLLFSGMALGYVLRTCTSLAIIAMTNRENANPNFPEYKWSSFESTLVESSFFWGYILSMLPSGWLVGSWSAHKIMAFGMFFSSILHVLGPWLADYGLVSLICNRFFVGLFQGGLVPSVHTLLSRWVPPPERSRLGSFVMNGPQFGTIITMMLSGNIAASDLGWPGIFYIFGAVACVWSVIFFFVAADSPSKHSKIKPLEAQYINSSLGNLHEATEKPKVPWRAIFTSRPFWALLIVHCGYNWGLYIFFTALPKFMSYVLHFDIKQSGILTSLPYVVMWLMGFPISYASDWAISRGVSVTTSRKVANSIGDWIPAATLVIICLTTNVVSSTVIVAIMTIGIGFNSGVSSGLQINHIDLSPKFAGAMMSITNTLANMVGVAAQLCFGLLIPDKEDENQWFILFYCTAAVYFFTNLVFVLFGDAKVQSWNNQPNQFEVRQPYPKRVSLISFTGEPTSLYMSEQIEEEMNTPI